MAVVVRGGGTGNRRQAKTVLPHTF